MTSPPMLDAASSGGPVAVLVAGLPELGRALGAHPDLTVSAPPADVGLRPAVNDLVEQGVAPGAVIIATAASDPALEETAAALLRCGFAVIAINGLDHRPPVHDPAIPTLTAPFTANDAVGVIRAVTGSTTVSEVPVLAAHDRLFTPPPPRPVGPEPTATGGWVPPPPPPPAPPPPRAAPAPSPGPAVWPAALGADPPGPATDTGPAGPWTPVAPARPQRAPRPGPAWEDDPFTAPVTPRPAHSGRPQVIVFACPKGGSGKTSLSLSYAAFLGAALEDRGRRVIWVDANVEQADGARYLGADERTSRSVTDLVGRPELDDRAVLSSVTAPEATGQPMWALLGPRFKREADPAAVTPELYREAVQVLRRHFDYIVVDTPVAEHYDRLFRGFALPEADVLTVVVPPLLPVVRGVREWLELQVQPVAAGGVAYPAARVRVVLNMDSPASGCPVEAVRDAWLTRWTWAGTIPYDPGWTAATNDGTLMAGQRDLAGPLGDLVRSTTGEIIETGRRRPGARRGWGERIVSLFLR